jgi:YegS/Rv2252/BmrU family lipid kinase
MKRIGVVIHGRYGRASKLEREIQRTFVSEEAQAFVGVTDARWHAGEWSREFIGRGCTHLLVAGGDGSLHQALQAIMEQPPEKRPVLIPFPVGSGNDFARTIGAKADLSTLAAHIRTTAPFWTDCGEISVQTPEGAHTSWFLNIADAGLGGEVARYLHRAPRWMWPGLMYQWSILRTLFYYKPVNICVISESFTFDGPCLNVVLANGKFFGGGLHIAPDASITDGKLDVLVLGDFSISDYLRFLPDIKRGKKINHREAHYFTAESVQLVAPEASLEADGEFVGTSPIQARVIPRAFQLLV